MVSVYTGEVTWHRTKQVMRSESWEIQSKAYVETLFEWGAVGKG